MNWKGAICMATLSIATAALGAKNTTTIRVAVLAMDGFEESELKDPVRALKDAQIAVDVVSVKPGRIQGYKSHEKSDTVQVDKTLDVAKADDYDALVLPGGGWNADTLRVVPEAQEFVRAFERERKPIAAICHAPWILISAGLVPGRTLTSYHTIKDDIQNAGGQWKDAEVVVDGNWITSRKPDDIPAFNREILTMLKQVRTPAAQSKTKKK